MPLFYNHDILHSSSDVIIGAVLCNNEHLSYSKYENLLSEKIRDMIEAYVEERKAHNKKLKTEDIVGDLISVVTTKLNVAVDGDSIDDLVEAITESERFSVFLSDIKHRFSKAITLADGVPVDGGISDSDKYFAKENIEREFNETNIFEFIEAVRMYGLTELL